MMNCQGFFLVLIIVSLLSSSCSNYNREDPVVKDGFLNLSSWDFEKYGAVNLNGDWEFYWQKLLEPKDFVLNNSTKPEYIDVPGGWYAKNREGRSYSEFGYATYRLKILVPDKQTDYKLRFSSIFSSTKVWINGEYCFECGKVGSNRESSDPKFLVNYIYKEYINYVKSDTLEIVIQVSDFYKGGPYAGIKRHISFGPEKQIFRIEYKANFTVAFLLGILLLFALYHLFIFIYKTEDLSYLIFSLMCINIVSRVIYTSGIFIEYFSYNSYNKLGFVAWDLSGALMIIFFYFLYKNEINKKVVYAIVFLTLILLVTALFASANTISRIDTIIIIYGLVIFIYLLGYSLLKAIVNKRNGSIIAYVGVLILLTSVIHDYLFVMGYIQGFGKYITETGFGLYVLAQALTLAKGYSQSFKDNIILNNELEYQNKNLESIVLNRTRVIEEQKIGLQNQNLSLIQQKIEIQDQNIALNQKNKEITDSLNYAKRIQSAILPPETYIGELLHENFIYYRPKDIVSGDFYWIKEVNQYIILAASDCTGHGVPGAFMSMLGLSYLNEIVQRREITQANQILNELRSQIKRSLRQHGQSDESKDGMDIALCVIDKKNLMMQFAGAYNPLIKIRVVNGIPELEEIKADRMPVGFYFGLDKSFTNNEIQLEIGDALYIFSDGYMDQIGGKDEKKFMSKKFKELLLEIYDQPMHAQKEILDSTLQEWKGKNAQTDDVLVIGVRI